MMNGEYIRPVRTPSEHNIWKYMIYSCVVAYYVLATVISLASGGSRYAKYTLLLALVVAVCAYVIQRRGEFIFRLTDFHLYLAEMRLHFLPYSF